MLCVLIGFSTLVAKAAENGLSLEQRVTRMEALQQPGAVPVNTGDNAWVLASSALVLMMTAPGLILFYGGLVRSKNVLATMMHSLILMALVSALWMVFGYSMAFAPGNAFVGNPLTYFMLHGVGGAPNPDYAGTVPQQSFMLFQMMFAIITPALISGAVAERIKFKAYVLFTVLWVTVVYFPLCHMVWGKGGYFNWALGGQGSGAGFRRRHGGAYQLRRFGAGVRAGAGQAHRLSAGADAAAQRRAEPHRHGIAVGRLVRVQRRQRAERRHARHQRICRDAFFRGRGGVELGGGGMVAQGQAQRARRGLRHGRGTGHHHARRRDSSPCRRRSASGWPRAWSAIWP